MIARVKNRPAKSGRVPLADTIGAVAKRLNLSVATIRFYENEGLIGKLWRSPTGRRVLDYDSIRRLHFIRNARRLGFGLDQVRALLGLLERPDAPCSTAEVIAKENLADVRARLAQLRALEHELQRLLDCKCDAVTADCRIIEALTTEDRR